MTLVRRMGWMLGLQHTVAAVADLMPADDPAAADVDRRLDDALQRLDYLEAQAEVLDLGKRARAAGRGPRR